MMIGCRSEHERYCVVLGLSAVGMTYKEMTRYIGVSSRQRVQQLLVSAVAKLPQLAERLGVSGQRQSGRRPKEDHRTEIQREGRTVKHRTPNACVIERHVATARMLLSQHGGRYPGATEMQRLGHSALYQFMRKYPHNFECLIHERPVSAGKATRIPKRRRKRRF